MHSESTPLPAQGSSKAAFIERATHEIQGSFMGIAAYCMMIKETIEERKDAIGLLDNLMEVCQVYKYRLRNLLEYARLDAGLSQSVPDAIDPRSALTSVVNELEAMANGKDLELILSFSPEFPRTIEA